MAERILKEVGKLKAKEAFKVSYYFLHKRCNHWRRGSFTNITENYSLFFRYKKLIPDEYFHSD